MSFKELAREITLHLNPDNTIIIWYFIRLYEVTKNNLSQGTLHETKIDIITFLVSLIVKDERMEFNIENKDPIVKKDIGVFLKILDESNPDYTLYNIEYKQNKLISNSLLKYIRKKHSDLRLSFFPSINQKLKILTWNVNGFRSNLIGEGNFHLIIKELEKKELLTSENSFPNTDSCKVITIPSSTNLGQVIEKEDPDILCFQETKCDKEIYDCIKIRGYYQYWNHSKSKGPRSGSRYSGVSIWSKQEPIQVTFNIPNLPVSFEEGRVITVTYPSFTLVNTYVPNSMSNFEIRVKEWDPRIKEYLTSIQGNVLWCGDLNVALTKQDVFFGNPESKSYNKIAVETGRDRSGAIIPGFTLEERKGLSDILKTGYVDIYRELYPEKKDAFTWFNYRIPAFRKYNKGWRIDYFIAKREMMDCIKSSEILLWAGLKTKPIASDHVPLTCSLDWNCLYKV